MEMELNSLPASGESGHQEVSAEVANRVIDFLRRELVSTPVVSYPIEHGSVAYRLGLAYSEFPGGDPHVNARKALSCFQLAADLFDPDAYPILHARVVNAAGISLRVLGELEKAANLFERAAKALAGKDERQEYAASLSNLGLVKMELGESSQAVVAFDAALGVLEISTTEPWVWAALMYNRGLAHAASDTLEGLRRAIEDYRSALKSIDPASATNLYGLIHHSMGVAETSIGLLLTGEDSQAHFHEAIISYNEALDVFVRGDFPFQNALIMHNASVALFGLGGDRDLRKALVNVEQALVIFDPRIHPDPWKRSYSQLHKVEKELAKRFPGITRSDQFAILVSDNSEGEAKALLGDRLNQIFALPPANRMEALLELSSSIARLGPQLQQQVLEIEFQVLMEFPPERLEEVLRAQLDLHRRLSPSAKEDADKVLDLSIGNALNTPQRVFVRDFLYSVGFVRP